MWLLTEGERVSSDRFFRVRTIQPFSEISRVSRESSQMSSRPHTANSVNIGDICVFDTGDCGFRVGFAYFKEKYKKAKEYKYKSVVFDTSLEKEHIGVLCTWYKKIPDKVFTLSTVQTHQYQSLSTYVCTLPFGCLASIDCHNDAMVISPTTIMKPNNEALSIMTSKTLPLTDQSLSIINKLVAGKSTTVNITTTCELEGKTNSIHWIQFKKYALTVQDRDAISNDKWLTDIHVGMAQILIGHKFPNINGLQSTS